jgi:hypothetical protein
MGRHYSFVKKTEDTFLTKVRVRRNKLKTAGGKDNQAVV